MKVKNLLPATPPCYDALSPWKGPFSPIHPWIIIPSWSSAGGMRTVLIAAAALLLDWLLGEPRPRHPLVGFGRLALYCERRPYGGAGVAPGARRARGACATLLLLAPFTAAAATLAEVPYLGTVVCVAVLYLALGHRSLHDHARPVAAPSLPPMRPRHTIDYLSILSIDWLL